MAQTKSDVNTPRTTDVPRTSDIPRTGDATDGASTDQIRRDIRHTRGEMDETLDELGERLHPRRLLDELLDLLSPKDGTGSSAAETVSRSLKRGGKSVSKYARENPIPTLLMTAGVAWAIYDAARDDDEEGVEWTGGRHFGYGTGGAGGETLAPEHSEFWDEGEQAKDKEDQPGQMQKAKQAASAAKDSVAGAASKVGRAGSRTWRRTSRASRRGYRKAGEMTQAAGEFADRSWERTRQGMSQARDRFDEASTAYPLAVGGGFIAAGLLAGLLLPRTRVEDEWMGEMSDEAWDEAKSTGDEVLDKGRTKVEEAASAAMDEAEAQGLTLEKLGEKASRVASQVGETVKQASKKEGLDPESMKDKAKQVGAEAKGAAKTPQSSSRPRADATPQPRQEAGHTK